MVEQVLEGLAIRPNGKYLDATAGGGGHTAAILDKLDEQGRVLAVDRDRVAVETLHRRFIQESRVTIHLVNFGRIGEDATVTQFAPLDGILFDFGVSSRQIDDQMRGFSYLQPGPLDMRMDRAQELSAADVVNRYKEADLIRILRDFGEEPRAKPIAAAIVELRPVETTEDLAQAVETVVWGKDRVKTLSRVFQALRIEVNGELDEIDEALQASVELLKPGGRLVTLSYHSLEDRRVKRFLRDMEGVTADRFSPLPDPEPRNVLMKATPRKAVVPSQEEIEQNPRARSAKLRIAEKIGG